MNRIFAIGDIHGCYDELESLMRGLVDGESLKPKKDTVVFMGDYIDRGPDSFKVVSRLMKWHKEYPHWIFLYGNHEDILRNWIDGKQKYQENMAWSCFFYNGGRQTLSSYGIRAEGNVADESKFPKRHLNFLINETRMTHETEDYIFVHAGLVPKIPTPKHLTNEVYKNAMLWAREAFIDSKWDWGKKVIFGHSPAYKARWGKFGQPIIMKNKIGIDGAVCSNKLGSNLIAVELPVEKFYFQEAIK